MIIVNIYFNETIKVFMINFRLLQITAAPHHCYCSQANKATHHLHHHYLTQTQLDWGSQMAI